MQQTKADGSRPVKQPRKLEAEVGALDQAADEIRIMSGGFDAEAAGVWRSALDRLISTLESAPEYFAEFGFHVMTFKKDHPTFSDLLNCAKQLKSQWEFWRQTTASKRQRRSQGGVESEDGVRTQTSRIGSSRVRKRWKSWRSSSQRWSPCRRQEPCG